jgi:hypothetical protein
MSLDRLLHASFREFVRKQLAPAYALGDVFIRGDDAAVIFVLADIASSLGVYQDFDSKYQVPGPLFVVWRNAASSSVAIFVRLSVHDIAVLPLRIPPIFRTLP